MSTIRPVRLQLSRAAGFDLQDLSLRYNRRPCVNVTRPGRWGNRFSIAPTITPGATISGRYIAVPTLEDAIECFWLYLIENHDLMLAGREAMHGCNVACWCKPHEKCHGDIWLEVSR